MIPTSGAQSDAPTNVPTQNPTRDTLTNAPTTNVPTSEVPTKVPTMNAPTNVPTTNVPTTNVPTTMLPPSGAQSDAPTQSPTQNPTWDTLTNVPTTMIPTPGAQSDAPTQSPTRDIPTNVPTTNVPTTRIPTSGARSEAPTQSPTRETLTIPPLTAEPSTTDPTMNVPTTSPTEPPWTTVEPTRGPTPPLVWGCDAIICPTFAPCNPENTQCLNEVPPLVACGAGCPQNTICMEVEWIVGPGDAVVAGPLPSACGDPTLVTSCLSRRFGVFPHDSTGTVQCMKPCTHGSMIGHRDFGCINAPTNTYLPCRPSSTVVRCYPDGCGPTECCSVTFRGRVISDSCGTLVREAALAAFHTHASETPADLQAMCIARDTIHPGR